MARVSFPALAALAAAAFAVLLTTCEHSLSAATSSATAAASADDTAELLRGTWLREYSEPGVSVQRRLSLERDGAFREHVRVVEQAGRVTEFAHEGTWLYDGTNLKRKYTLMNGRPPSRLNVPFATFEISFASPNEFTGVDHIRGHRIQYRRIGYDKLP